MAAGEALAYLDIVQVVFNPRHHDHGVRCLQGNLMRSKLSLA